LTVNTTAPTASSSSVADPLSKCPTVLTFHVAVDNALASLSDRYISFLLHHYDEVR
jgi:hypothetical protein